MSIDLRERTHEAMRAEMAQAGLQLILDRGYDTLTADELARGLGISRATFFRYLGSKDELIVSAVLGPVAQFADALRAADPDPQSSWWQRLRTAFEPAVALAEQHPDRQRARMRLIQTLPAVGARLRRARAPQIESLADALIDDGLEIFAAHVLATASVAVLDQCWAHWLHDESSSLRAILDRAFQELDSAGRTAQASEA